MAKNTQNPIPDELYNMLACPACKGDLRYTSDKKGLFCAGCGTKYPIKDGIPVLLTKK
ncbi:MAG TPA: Trm112 family protein [Candidatus Nanoarchaeia archaeon]|nr:Trm112 family protein [Candidatus Nanoarchaeia archaeon]